MKNNFNHRNLVSRLVREVIAPSSSGFLIYWLFIDHSLVILGVIGELINFRLKKIRKFYSAEISELRGPGKIFRISKNLTISLFSTYIFEILELFRKIHDFRVVLELTSHVLHVLTNLYMIAFEVSV